MPVDPGFAGELRRLLRVVHTGLPNRRETNDIVCLCHDIATAIVRRKIQRANLDSRLHYSSYGDLAYDCIGELCQRDEQGRLWKLQNYFAGVNIEDADDAELLIHIRRLISSCINQTIFRIYGELDPQLAKVLRNIKLALKSGCALSPVEKFGEWYLVPAVAETNEHLPICDVSDLERVLSVRRECGTTTPELLSQFAKFLSEQTTNSRLVSLLTVARAVRSVYGRDNVIAEHEEMEDGFLQQDTLAVIQSTCRLIDAEYGPKYVRTGGLTRGLFADYMAVVEQTLVSRLLENDGAMATLYERLSSTRLGMSREAYYRDHRSVLEYLVRLSYDRVVGRLKAVL